MRALVPRITGLVGGGPVKHNLTVECAKDLLELWDSPARKFAGVDQLRFARDFGLDLRELRLWRAWARAGCPVTCACGVSGSRVVSDGSALCGRCLALDGYGPQSDVIGAMRVLGDRSTTCEIAAYLSLSHRNVQRICADLVGTGRVRRHRESTIGSADTPTTWSLVEP